MKDKKATVAPNKNDHDSSTDCVCGGVFDLSLEKSTTRQMVSVSPRASSGETTRDIDEFLTVHGDVL